MKMKFNLKDVGWGGVTATLIPLVFFWIILLLEIPFSFSKYFSSYSLGLFLIVFCLYYLSFRLPDRRGIFACLGLTLVLFALPLSFKWTSGFSDNMVIGGLLPYKDAKNYYHGANLILNGLPVIDAGQSTERPLFPGFLSALLVLMDQNLKIALAVMVQLAGIGLYLSIRQIHRVMGIAAASLFGSLMYFYIQPLIGYALSEVLGFMLGCFAFILILQASHTLKRFDLTIGLLTLMVAVSARAGAFIVFPLLAVWVGWAFRGDKRYSWKAFAFTMLAVLACYFAVNTIYARLLGIPPGSAFGNFSYAIYGQVRGGTGWHSAIDELGTRNPASVYRAALQFFLAHPASLLIGFVKSYRDFFLPGDRSIFAFKFWDWRDWQNFLVWAGMMVLLVRGIIHLLKDFRSNVSLMLLLGFTGIVLSIPFLPPIDGGARFYASTMPFFFAIPALGISGFSRNSGGIMAREQELEEVATARLGSIVLTMITLVVPVWIYTISQPPSYTVPVCPSRQQPFAMEIHQESYIDLIKDGTQQCGSLPAVCLSNFDENNIEKSVDDYYQYLLQYLNENIDNARIVPAIDLVGGKFHYFYIPYDKLPSTGSPGLMTGCAVEVETKNQTIYQVESVLIDGR